MVIKRTNTIMERRSKKMRRMKFLSSNKLKIIRNNIWRRRWVLISNNKNNSMNLFSLNTTTKRKKLIKRMNKIQIRKIITVKMRKDSKILMTLWNIQITRKTVKNQKNKNKMMMRVKIEYQKPIDLFIF
jgi:Mg/Co/Ni transporter MgtE